MCACIIRLKQINFSETPIYIDDINYLVTHIKPPGVSISGKETVYPASTKTYN